MMRRAALATLAVALLALAGCADESSPSDGAHGASDAASDSASDAASGAPSDAASDAAKVGWSPCDGLPAGTVGRLVGERVTQRTGTPDAPRCTFTPRAKGGAAYDISYLWFDGGLDAALDAMGATGAQLKPVDVPGADSARMVVRTQKAGVLVTGFVQTARLVQSVNAVQLRPYDERRVVAGTKALLAELAAQAPTASAR